MLKLLAVDTTGKNLVAIISANYEHAWLMRLRSRMLSKQSLPVDAGYRALEDSNGWKTTTATAVLY